MKMLLLGLLLALAQGAGAVVIEGTTPSGKFKTVGLSENGRFLVETATGALTHVVVDSGTITAFQGGAPWAVTTAVGVAVTVKASTSAVTFTSQFITGPGLTSCYPADTNRKQGVLCNSSDSVNIYVGNGAMSTANGAILGPGSCYSPDVPAAFIGELFCRSTATASGFFIYSE